MTPGVAGSLRSVSSSRSFRGSASRNASSCSANPSASMRSASSMTSMRARRRRSAPLSSTATSLPGVPTTSSARPEGCASCSSCSSWLAPPYTLTHRTGADRRSLPQTAKICSASSRVGATTNARGSPAGSPRRASFPAGKSRASRSANSTAGSRYASVLPLPGGATPRRSRPAHACGQHSRWIGVLPLCPSALSASAKYSGTPAPSAFFFWFSRASASSSASSSEDTSSSSPRPRFGPFICDRGFAAPGTPFAAIFSRNARAAAFRFSSFFLALRSAAARASSSSRSLGGNGGSLAHMPRCLRGTVLPPRMRRPSSVFWDMRLLFFLALLRWLKSTVMATDRRAMCHGKVGGFRRRLRFDTERARGAGCPSRNWNSGDARARVLRRSSAPSRSSKPSPRCLLVTTWSRVGLEREGRHSTLGDADG